jgi:nitrate reductase gamma subunit
MNSVGSVAFAYAPYLALIVAVGGWLLRWQLLPRDRIGVPDVSAPTAAALALGFAMLALGHVTTSVAPGAMRALLADPDRVAVIEAAGLIGALLFAFGIAARLRIRMRALDTGVERQAAPVAVLALLLIISCTGIALTVRYRWLTVWYAYVSVPYVRSVIATRPITAAVVASPWPIQLHTLLFMLLLAVWPLSGLDLDEIFPLRAVARRYGALGDDPPAARGAARDDGRGARS